MWLSGDFAVFPGVTVATLPLDGRVSLPKSLVPFREKEDPGSRMVLVARYASGGRAGRRVQMVGPMGFILGHTQWAGGEGGTGGDDVLVASLHEQLFPRTPRPPWGVPGPMLLAELGAVAEALRCLEFGAPVGVVAQV